MIIVTRVTAYDSVGNHITKKVSQSFCSQKDAKEFYINELTSDKFKVEKILIDYEEEEI